MDGPAPTSANDRRGPDDPPFEPTTGGVRRPPPPTSSAERLAAWLRWFGPARLVATALSVVVVSVVGFWLVRAPVPSAEATLPSAGATSLPTVTLPPPSAGSGSIAPTLPPASPTTAPTDIVVHVAGAVREPGVFDLPVGARVDDAIRRAGGAADDADLDAVNLAHVLADGQRLFVPESGVVDHASTPVLTPPSGVAATDDGAAADDVATGPIDINVADVDELERLPGVGPATARAIVDDRTRNGPFVTVDDLERVPGVGPAKLAGLRDLVSV